MLTGFQVSTGGYRTEHGELLCESCFDEGETYCVPVSNYELDEWQSGWGQDYYSDSEDHVDDCECEPELYCDGCNGELREAYVGEACKRLQDEGEDDE